VRSFARQRPGAFLAIAAAAGVVAGRLTRGLTASGDSNVGGSSDRGATSDAARSAASRASIGRNESVATAPTLPIADVRETRPVDDPGSLGGSPYYAGGESSQSSTPYPPVPVTDEPR
jgi:hypothetical protein